MQVQEQLLQKQREAAEQLEQVMIDADLTVGRAKGDLARLKSRMSEELTQEQEGSQKLQDLQAAIQDCIAQTADADTMEVGILSDRLQQACES